MDNAAGFVKKIFSEKQLDGLLIASPVQIAYLTGYHGFSLVEREAFLLITTKKHILFTDSRYTKEVQEQNKDLTVLERSHSKPTSLLVKELLEKQAISRLGFEPDVLTVAEYKQLKPKNVTFVPISLHNLRIHKTPTELSAIQQACTIGDKAFAYIQTKIKANMTEKELAKLLELYIKELDAELSFATIVAFGKNAAIPHHHTDQTKLKPGNCILLDFGVKYQNYCSDMTRTIFFGKPTVEHTKIYETVKQAQQKAIEFVNHELSSFAKASEDKRIMNQVESKKANNRTMKQSNNLVTKPIHTSKVDYTARSYITSQNYPTIPHSLGHGIGLEVHEAPSLSPKSTDNLEEGMVFSIEPGIYLYEKNIGVRIEDLFAIKDGKLLQLTHAPSELIIV